MAASDSNIADRQNLICIRLFSIFILVICGINCSDGFPLEEKESILADDRRTSRSDEIGVVHEDDCPTKPKITVVAYKRFGFVPSTPGLTELVKNTSLNSIQAPFVSNVEIECIARSPVEWTFDGVNYPPAKVVDVLRESGEKTGTCFTITIRMETTKKATGNYRCRTVDNKYSSQLFVFGEANTPPALLNNGLNIEMVSNGSSSVILPCEMVTGTLKPPALFKGNNNENIAAGGSVPYDARIGFTLDLENIPNPYDTYRCRTTTDIVTITLKGPPDFKVSPDRKILVAVRDQRIRLTCQSKLPATFEGAIDKTRITPDDISSEYKHGISYEFLATESSTISCVDKNSNKIYHTWNLKVISQQTQLNGGIFYDSSSEKFFCRSKTENAPGIALSLCSNPMNCLLVDKCFPKKRVYRDIDCDPKIIARDFSTCNESDRTELNSTSTACSYVKTKFEAGTVYCSLDGEDDHKMVFFRGIDSNKSVITDWTTAPQNQLVDMKKPKNPDRPFFYVGEYVEFQCDASSFLFARGFNWKYLMNDGSTKPVKVRRNILTDVKISDDLERSTISEMVTIKITSLDIKAVVCYAPFWNTTDWMNASQAVTLRVGAKPRILNEENDTKLEFSVGTNQSVLCRANGLPEPQLRWFRNNMPLNIGESNSSNTNGWLHFGIVDKDDEGEYVCQASNSLGSANQAFRLAVKDPSDAPRKFLLITGVIFFVCFLSIVLVLWRKLRKNQDLVQKLMSAKDVKKFYDGDKEALMSAPPDGYIRADILRYDSGYEIPEENLNIDEENVLGEGEYGIVLKGKLKCNNNEKEVAVKTSKGSDAAHFKALLSELKILTYIRSSGWHENVIDLFGAVTRNLKYHDVYVVVEYCHLGSLESFLRANKDSYLHQIGDDRIDFAITFNANQANGSNYVANNYAMTTHDLISWSHQVASGMEYLASKKVVHGDLATRNILLTEDRTAKITDFGLSIQLYNECSNNIPDKPGPLPWKWAAPEILQYNNFSTQSDVWAFGVTLWEIFSLGDTPYPGLVCNMDFRTRLFSGARMEKPEFANTELYNRMNACWQNVPNERTTFLELKRFFHQILHCMVDPIIPSQKTHAFDNVVYLDPESLVLLEE